LDEQPSTAGTFGRNANVSSQSTSATRYHQDADREASESAERVADNAGMFTSERAAGFRGKHPVFRNARSSTGGGSSGGSSGDMRRDFGNGMGEVPKQRRRASAVFHDVPEEATKEAAAVGAVGKGKDSRQTAADSGVVYRKVETSGSYITSRGRGARMSETSAMKRVPHLEP
jgi:hypothetical protein